jgi:hypothetical protein
MTYLKVILSLFGGVFLMLAICAWPVLSRSMAGETVGFDPISEVRASPFFWIEALAFSGLFLAASRIQNSRLIRISFFWIPTVVLCMFGLPWLAFLTYAVLHIRP